MLPLRAGTFRILNVTRYNRFKFRICFLLPCQDCVRAGSYHSRLKSPFCALAHSSTPDIKSPYKDVFVAGMDSPIGTLSYVGDVADRNFSYVKT